MDTSYTDPDREDARAEARAESLSARRRHWCDVCHGHTGPGSPCYEPQPSWCVVADAGTDDEVVWSEHPTYAEALRAKRWHGDDDSVDVMKRRADGSLTTEF